MNSMLTLSVWIILGFAGTPELTVADDLCLSLPADLLAEPKFEKQLTSGLTLSLALRYDDRRGHAGAVLVEIRYEPWDEVFFVRTIGDALPEQNMVMKDRAALMKWLTEPGIPLMRGARPSEGRVEVSLSILPFSAVEQERARNWVRVSRATPVADVGDRAGGGLEGTGALASLLVTGSIKRSSILSYRWVLRVP